MHPNVAASRQTASILLLEGRKDESDVFPKMKTVMRKTEWEEKCENKSVNGTWEPWKESLFDAPNPLQMQQTGEVKIAIQIKAVFQI